MVYWHQPLAQGGCPRYPHHKSRTGGYVGRTPAIAAPGYVYGPHTGLGCIYFLRFLSGFYIPLVNTNTIVNKTIDSYKLTPR
jgi:hypothetical protein